MALPQRSRLSGKDQSLATSIICAFMDIMIAFIFLMGATISYLTSKLIIIFDLHPPCFNHGEIWANKSKTRLQTYRYIDCSSNELCMQKSTSSCQLNYQTSSSESDFWSSLEGSRHDFSLPGSRCLPGSALDHMPQLYPSVFPFHRICFDCRSLIQRQSHCRFVKRKLESLSSQELTSSGRVSDDSIVDAKECQLEREHSFKVFPEELINDHALDDALESKQRLESLQNDSPDSSVSGGLQVFGNSHHIRSELGGILEASGSMEAMESSRLLNETEVSKVIESPATFLLNFDRGFNPLDVATSSKVSDVNNYALTSESDSDIVKIKERLSLQQDIVQKTYLELEKERTASALSAGEAMATIRKLQKDKAALQMEAMQYQRFAEEKEMFDEEALTGLRDVLVKREAEMLALEKEIEVYRIKVLRERMKAAEKRKVIDHLANDGNDKVIEISGLGGGETDVANKSFEPDAADKHLLELVDGVDAASTKSSVEALANQSGSWVSGDNTSLSSLNDMVAEGKISKLKDSGAYRKCQGDTVGVLTDNSEPGDILHVSCVHTNRTVTTPKWQHVLECIWNLEEQIDLLKSSQTKHVRVFPPDLTSQGCRGVEMGSNLTEVVGKFAEAEDVEFSESHLKGHNGMLERTKDMEGNLDRTLESWAFDDANNRVELENDTMDMRHPLSCRGPCSTPRNLYKSFASALLEVDSHEMRSPDLVGTMDSPPFLSPKMPSCDWRSASMVMRDNSRKVLKDDVVRLMSRLQVLEADRDSIKQTILSLRKESGGVEMLQEAAQELRLWQSCRDLSDVPTDIHWQLDDDAHTEEMHCPVGTELEH